MAKVSVLPEDYFAHLLKTRKCRGNQANLPRFGPLWIDRTYLENARPVQRYGVHSTGQTAKASALEDFHVSRRKPEEQIRSDEHTRIRKK
jgi:hypothetical protein